MAVECDDYELIDFGGGRKLERLGGVVVDRPCPAAARFMRHDAARWPDAAIRYDDAPGGRGRWDFHGVARSALDTWRYRQHAPFSMELALAPLPSGQVGMFAEQAANWSWVFEQVRRAGRPLRVLNLFAYTGASTIAAAAGGAEVTHVDAAKGIVERASQNAALSGLADAPMRWIVDDAVKFCIREARRGSRYDAVILDPPTYGHGKRGEAWQFKRDLPGLLETVMQLTDRAPAFFLLTCHTTGIDADRLAMYLTDAGLKPERGQFDHGPMQLRTTDGRELAAGVFVRYPTPTKKSAK
jgi:23S rRNA (cytosine1962-C5)-methyltransferase